MNWSTETIDLLTPFATGHLPIFLLTTGAVFSNVMKKRLLVSPVALPESTREISPRVTKGKLINCKNSYIEHEILPAYFLWRNITAK